MNDSMNLHGKNIAGGELSGLGQKTFFGYDPRAGRRLKTPFYQATEEEVNRAMELAAQAFPVFRESPAPTVAGFLETIAAEIEALGEQLIQQAAAETGLGIERLRTERGRTVNQLRMFAGLIREGSFVDARIDPALADRKPVSRPDVRRMLIPVGPVVVFGAGNFPLAYSVAGGDTASALAAKNPVVVKGHPAHPGTSELVAGAVTRAVRAAGLPAGVFSMLQGSDPSVSLALVRHAQTKTVAFTGSLRAGRAIFDAATCRPEPIPVYAEMGSTNPVFVLPNAAREQADALAQGLTNSVCLGAGQFCTCPGLIFTVDDQAFAGFRDKLRQAFDQTAPATMLHPGIAKGYEEAVRQASKIAGVALRLSPQRANSGRTEGAPALLETDAATWLANELLHNEVFGPSTIVVRGRSEEELLRVAESLRGTLTATVHGTPEDLKKFHKLIALLETRCGRLIFNGYPTGVEVGPAMHHGGPYPATTDPKFTSVGTAAILRFLRPICYQNFPHEALPPELRNENPGKIWRTVDGVLTRDPVKTI
jgi:NADP-dependent aldehyde dehydrogenase